MKDFLKKLWSTPKGKAIIKLSVYIIFIIFVIVFINISQSFGKIEKESVKYEKDITIQDMKDNLLKNNYKYVYTINNNDQKIVYSGERLKDEEIGTKETVNETIKYYVDGNEYYQLKMGDKVSIDNLYDNIDINLLDSEYIINLIKDKSTIIDKKDKLKEYNYNFSIEDKDISISLFTNEKEIVEIDISHNDITYVLKYSDICKISKLNIE